MGVVSLCWPMRAFPMVPKMQQQLNVSSVAWCAQFVFDWKQVSIQLQSVPFASSRNQNISNGMATCNPWGSVSVQNPTCSDKTHCEVELDQVFALSGGKFANEWNAPLWVSHNAKEKCAIVEAMPLVICWKASVLIFLFDACGKSEQHVCAFFQTRLEKLGVLEWPTRQALLMAWLARMWIWWLGSPPQRKVTTSNGETKMSPMWCQRGNHNHSFAHCQEEVAVSPNDCFQLRQFTMRHCDKVFRQNDSNNGKTGLKIL